jgi:hypothetical protein
MEIVTVTDLSAIPRVIEWNHEELKTELRTQLEVYKNLVVTPDAIKSAKSDRANLNKLATAVEEYRKDVKRRCLEPYNELEAKCKELVGIIKEPIEAIDTQIKAFEEQEKDEKYKALKEFFESKVGDMADTIVFEKILDPKWGNKSKGLDELKGSLEDHIDRVREELKKLEEQFGDVPYKVAVVNKYMENYNYSAALVEATTLKFRYEQEQKKKQAAEEALKATRQKREEQAQVQLEPVSEQAQPVQQTVPVTNEPVGTVSFTVKGTRAQIIALREFMKSNGIQFAVIRK